MNYELKYIDNDSISSIGESRRIKLRKVSFANVNDTWKGIVKNNVSEIPDQTDNEVTDSFVTNDNNDFVENDTIKVNVNLDDINDEIFILDPNYLLIDSIKRRVLAISKEMYDNIIFNVNNTLQNSNLEDNNMEINEDEIKQAVKDAFEQIDFDKPEDNDIIITPEEVNSTVISYDNQPDESYDEDNSLDDISTEESSDKTEDQDNKDDQITDFNV